MKMEMIRPQVNTFGGSPVAVHNMPCAVCGSIKAVYHMSVNDPKAGCFSPCWDCQSRGWMLIQPKGLLRFIIRKFS